MGANDRFSRLTTPGRRIRRGAVQLDLPFQFRTGQLEFTFFVAGIQQQQRHIHRIIVDGGTAQRQQLRRCICPRLRGQSSRCLVKPGNIENAGQHFQRTV